MDEVNLNLRIADIAFRLGKVDMVLLKKEVEAFRDMFFVSGVWASVEAEKEYWKMFKLLDEYEG